MDEQQLLCLSANPQELLIVALTKRNIHYFRKALTQQGVDPEQQDQDEGNVSIFEKCCQTPGFGDYVRACLQWGCDPNKVNLNLGKSAINFAVESEDRGNLSALLESPGVDIDHLADSLTPLHQLVTQLTDDSFDQLFPCICMLIDHQADVNIANERSMPPILTVANHRKLDDSHKRAVIEYFLDNASVDLDLHRDGQARTTLEKKYPQLQLPPIIAEKDREWDLIRLFDALRNENEDLFRIGFPQFQKVRSDQELKETFAERLGGRTLLTMAVANRLIRAVQLLLRAGADVHDYQTTQNDSEVGPIRTACITGQYVILQMLLRSRIVDVNRSPVLIDVIKHIGQPIPKLFASSSDYNRCFDLLINEQNIDLNLQDSFGNTALHTAVSYKNKPVIRELLKRGAYIGTRNSFNRIAIEDIDTKLMKQHFDRCIQQNDRRSGDDNYELQFDYTNFVPAHYRTKHAALGPKLWSLKRYDEMIPIEYLAKSNDHKHLVKHPLIASFLYLKWQRFAPVFYTNFFIFLIFSLAMVPYIHLYYGKPISSGWRSAFYVVSIITAFYVVIREVIQFIMSPGQYLRKVENYLEIALIAMSALVLCGVPFDEEWQRTIAATTILFVVGELFILTGSLPVLSFTTHLVMLRTVTKTFLRSLMLYSIMLVAFALCFHTLLKSNTKEEEEVLPSDGGKTKKQEDEVDFNGFSNLYIALVKTVVMLTGEFDASDIKFQSMLPSYIIFVVFVFLFSAVLFNLLNGLAISDTQLIKSEAELTHFVYRSELLAKYEKISLGNGIHPFFNVIFYKFFFGQMCLFPDYLTANTIVVLPNQDNLVHIPAGPSSDAKNSSFGHTEDGALLTKATRTDVEHGCLSRLRQCASMEPKIVKYARAMLEQRASDDEAEVLTTSCRCSGGGGDGRDDDMDRRMRHMEETIDRICRNVERIAAKLDVSLREG